MSSFGKRGTPDYSKVNLDDFSDEESGGYAQDGIRNQQVRTTKCQSCERTCEFTQFSSRRS